MKKKIISVMTLIAITTALCTLPACVSEKANAETLSVIYDGEKLDFDTEPEIIDGRVMVPMRGIFEAFGAKVKWDGDTQTVTAKKKSKTVELSVGSNEMTKDGETVTADTAPIIENGRTLIPVRAVSELLELDVDWNEEERTVVISESEEETDDKWKENEGSINLSTLKTSGEGISVSGNVITITEGGDFKVSGTLDDGSIVIDTEDKVKLRLSGMSLTNTNGAAIYVKNADKAYITVTDGTKNTLKSANATDEEKGVITAKDTLEIKGSGSLTITAENGQGIHASDSLDIENGDIKINSSLDAINVNDTFAFTDGNLDITAGGDGIAADEIVDISGGKISITTTGKTDSESDVSSKGIKADWLLEISGGEIDITSTDHAIHSTSDINVKGGKITVSSDKKGISVHGDLIIDDGEISIEKSTEGIEAKQIMIINGGDININSSDDGINAGGNGSGFGGFGGGMMNSENAEGASGNMQRMTPPDMSQGENGNMQRMTPPDMSQGENANMQRGGRMRNMQGMENMTPPDMPQSENDTMPEMNGNENGGMQRSFGGGMNSGMSNEISSEHHIQINGGNIYVNAAGDGIDSNGSIVINGGVVTIDGPTMNGNSAFDHDGLFAVNGGTVIAAGSAGMMENPSSSSEQNVVSAYISADAGSKITVKESGGKEIMSYTLKKTAGNITFSSDKIESGKTYSIYVNGELSDTFTVNGALTTVGTASGGFGGMGGRGNMMMR